MSSTRSGTPNWLVGHAVLVGAVFALPGLFVFFRAAQLGGDLGSTASEVVGPLGRSVLLALSVGATATALGTMLAWLVVRSDLPGRRMWRLLLVLPLVFPSFVGAAAFLTSLAPGGLLHGLIESVGLEPPRRFRGFFPAWMVLTLFTYPYVLLPVAARLRALPSSLEEGARVLGRTRLGAIRSVTLPQLRPAMLAGGLLVFLYTISDFGAVQLLGYDTLTRVIFATRLSNRGVSFLSATLLILLAVAISAWARSAGPDQLRPDERVGRFERPAEPLGSIRLVALGFVSAVALVALVAPVLSLLTWSIRGLADGRVDLGELAVPLLNTAFVGIVTAILAVVVVVPLAVVTIRHRSKVANVSSVAVTGGFAVPGIVIALSLVFWALNTPGFSFIYQTFPLLILAYVIHFGSQALGAAEIAVRAVPDEIRESGRLLTPSRWLRRRQVEFPLMRPGLASGAGLVLLSTVKELPATLLLAPIGFETLSTEIWGAYEDGFYASAGTSSIVLVALSGLLTWALVLRRA